MGVGKSKKHDASSASSAAVSARDKRSKAAAMETRDAAAPGSSNAAEAGSSSAEPVVGQTWLGVTVLATHRIVDNDTGKGGWLIVSAGSVLDFEGDAIVNAANEGCITGGGVDGAITDAGGPELKEARQELPVVEGSRGVRCPTGEARITIGGSLKVPYCIHAVGPNYNVRLGTGKASLQECDELVANAYRCSLECAKDKEIQTVGFSLLSAGVFKGPQSLEKVLEMGIIGIRQGWYPGLDEVHLVAFTPMEQETLKEVCAAADLSVSSRTQAAPVTL